MAGAVKTERKEFDVLIVGGGHGGAQAAITLRQIGYSGSIAVISDEPEFPYERPPLSKEYFSGNKTVERIRIRPPAFWAEREITLILSERVAAIDAERHVATTQSGKALTYGKLIWAAGGTPRQLSLPEAMTSNVLAIRTLADADRLKAMSSGASHIVVIGGGYIGLEAAAVLTKAGKKVTLIEALDRVLARAAGVELSRFVEASHRAHGVDVRLSAKIAEFRGEDRIESILLEGGTQIDCDLVIVGIGISPEVAALKAAGAKCANGVIIDEYCRTSLPDIYAIGDCAAHRNTYAECATIRLESVQNAADMAKTVANGIAGMSEAYLSVPWFWSNQYDLRIQTIGLSSGHDETVVRGDMAGGSFAIVYLKDSRVIALDCVNATKDYVQGKALVMAGARIAPTLLADMAVPLKDRLAQ